VETSTLKAFVVKPIIISLSFTFSSLTEINAVVPPIVMFPVTFKLELMLVTPLTVRPVNVGLSVNVTVALAPTPVAVILLPIKLISVIPLEVPTVVPSSLTVIPVIALAGAAATQVGAAPTPFD
jgi:hypothetical protein